MNIPTKRTTIIPFIIIISFIIIIGYSSDKFNYYNIIDIDTSVDGVEIRYYKNLLMHNQRFRIIIKNISSNTYPISLSIYAWMPNGSIVELGKYIGKDGAVDVDISKIIIFTQEWNIHLTGNSNNPKLVKPGIIILGAIHTSSGVYNIIKGIPLNIDYILKGLSIEVKIIDNLTDEDLLIPIDEVKNIIKTSRHNTTLDYDSTMTMSIRASSSEWPPDEKIDYCSSYCDGFGCVYYCFIWRLEDVYATELNRGAPLVVAYVYGDTAKVNDVLLAEFFMAEESSDIEVAFSIAASVKKSSGDISYSIPGFTVALGGNRHIWLDYSKRFFYGIDFDGSSILAIGIRGDYAFAKYKLQYCYTSLFGWNCIDINSEANMTLARPVIVNNKIVPWYEIDTDPHDNIGVSEKAFKYLKSNWEWSNSYIEYGGIYMNYTTVINELNTISLFSVSLDILPLLLENPELIPIAAIASATVGLTQNAFSLMNLACDISLRSEYATDTYVWANYFYSPTQFEYDNNYYYLGSLYVDALVSVDAVGSSSR